MTRRLLLFSRRRVPQAKVLDLNHVVTSLNTMLQRLLGEEIELHLNLSPELGNVHADAGRIEQVLLNLAANSRDAMPHGGILTIETTNAVVDKPGGIVKPGAYVILTVKDNGAGMDANTQAHAFEPFFTTKRSGSGTGLGLYTVAGIIKQSGGAVELSSTPAVGTSFRVYLPRVDRAAATVHAPPAPRAAARGAETILLVEDDEMVRTLVRETMESNGYRVLEASDPLDARSIAGNYGAAIQLLITDVIMPKATGPELARDLLAVCPNLKVLYISGHTEPRHLQARRAPQRSGVFAEAVQPRPAHRESAGSPRKRRRQDQSRPRIAWAAKPHPNVGRHTSKLLRRLLRRRFHLLQGASEKVIFRLDPDSSLGGREFRVYAFKLVARRVLIVCALR